MSIELSSMQLWTLNCVGLTGALFLISLLTLMVDARVALGLFGAGCVGLLGSSMLISHLQGEEAGLSTYEALRTAVARDPALTGRARMALADGRLTNGEAGGIIDAYNADVRRHNRIQREAVKRQVIRDLAGPDRPR